VVLKVFALFMFVFSASFSLAQFGGQGECPDDSWDAIRERECIEQIEIVDEFGLPLGVLEYEGRREACVPTNDPVSCADGLLEPFCVPSIP
jgi:hypothetical protein